MLRSLASKDNWYLLQKMFTEILAPVNLGICHDVLHNLDFTFLRPALGIGMHLSPVTHRHLVREFISSMDSDAWNSLVAILSENAAQLD